MVRPVLGEEKRKTLLRRIEALGRWSMLDVFVVALLVVTIKLGILADVEVHAGVYFFAASVLASMVASLLMNRLVHSGDEAASTLAHGNNVS